MADTSKRPLPVPISGTNLAAPVVPYTTADKYPTHHSQYGRGGWHEVSTTGERDAIPEDRRAIGMAVHVTANGKTYILSQKDNTTYWKEMQSGTPVVSQTGNATIQPNVLNVWNTAVTTLTITKGTDIDGELNHYFVRFKVGTPAEGESIQITFAGFSLTWYAVNVPAWVSGKIYEISIINNLALWAEF